MTQSFTLKFKEFRVRHSSPKFFSCSTLLKLEFFTSCLNDKNQNSLQAEDYIDDILNGDSYADSLKYDPNTMGDARIKEEPQNFTEADARDRQKKDNHNMSKIT